MTNKWVLIHSRRQWAEYYKIEVGSIIKAGLVLLRGQGRWEWRLLKNWTNHSLPEIGEAFGGRDHTTVLYMCKVVFKIEANRSND